MARSSAPRSPAKPAAATATVKKADEPPKKKEGHRETSEAIASAFMIALVVRCILVEPFVIPTGSMAPTLMGRHKEITCPECGYEYAVNASEETESAYPRRVYSGICVNCRFQARVDREPSFKGDRIFVEKFPYDLPFLPGASVPERWDVVVFRYPEDPETSYIKRLVGLPGETIRIWRGDLFRHPPGLDSTRPFERIRKPLEHQRAMQMTVYDDAHRASSLKDHAEWQRWTAHEPGGWVEDTRNPGTYTSSPGDKTENPPTGWSELRYRHLVPDPGQWRAIEDKVALPHPPAPTLITDFYSYNTTLYAENSDLTGDVSPNQESAWLQPHWVGDLTVSCRISPESVGGVVRLELIEGGTSNRCEIRLAEANPTGTNRVADITLFHGTEQVGSKESGVSWASPHTVEFANVDNRLTLWIDGRPVFGDGVAYEDAEVAPAHPTATADDLSPVRVATNGAKVRVSDLVLKRDIYYTVDPMRTDYGEPYDERIPRSPAALAKFLADPAAVAALGPLAWHDFPIQDGHFMMLGDNSPRSKDSRGWGTADQEWDESGRQKWEVPRRLITGKAFCVYWPHGKPFGPDVRLGSDLRLPFRPYFERMKLIR